jgi:CheY-like chemotaxis protein
VEGSAVSPPRDILIVEDNPDAAEMLRELLLLRGHEVTVVETGIRALSVLHEREVEVVLCDLGLPGMSGFELARAIRADPSLKPPKLVAISGYGQPRDRQLAREAGFDDHLLKPVDVAAIERVLVAQGREH